MKIRGLLIVLVLAMAVVYFLYFGKAGKKSYLEATVDAHQRMSADLTRANMETLARAIDLFSGTEGRVPEDLKDLSRARLLTGATSDGWGRAFKYERLSDSGFRLTSPGLDGKFDTGDDIVLTR
jgi:hypothetical protein